MSVKFNSSGGGSVLLDAPSTASNLTVTLPSASGTLLCTGAPFSGGTANGVVYLNGSSVPTTGSALTWNGSVLKAVGGNDNSIYADNTGQQYSGLGIYNNGTRKSSVAWDNTNGQLNIVNDGNYPVTFGVSGTEQMRLTSTGLGIGTSSPSYKLDVNTGASNGGVAIRTGAGYNAFLVMCGNNATAGSGSLDIIQGNDGTAYFYNRANAAAIFATNNTERMRINAGAPILCLSGGNTSATGTGIAFPATQSASSDANTLDDYEEGTWTPVLAASSSSPTGVTYATQSGAYTKIGRQVTVSFNLIFSTYTGGSGLLRFTGLPFTAAATSIMTGSMTVEYMAFSSGKTAAVPYATNGSAALNFAEYGSNTNYLDINISAVASSATNKYIQGTITYFAAT